MKDGFIKVASATPAIRVADVEYNTAQVIALAEQAHAEGVRFLVLPELCITGYTCGDLFLQHSLQAAALAAVSEICRATAQLNLVLLAGLPLAFKNKLYNVAAVIKDGQVLGFIPKTNLPNYSEFYELRQFTPAFAGLESFTGGEFHDVPFGTGLLFACRQMEDFIFSAEICEDLWVPASPSVKYACEGALLIANLASSVELVGKSSYRRQLVSGQSAKLCCAYVFANSGCGESTTDVVYAGHNIVAENGVILAETPPFHTEMAVTEVDLQKLGMVRRRLTSFPPATGICHTIFFNCDPCETLLTRPVSATPFVPQEAALCKEHCETVLSIQAEGLAARMRHTGSKTAVIGLSGGLDSTLALLVIVRAFTLLQKPPEDILAVTMPAFGTTQRTKNNAEKLAALLGVSFKSIDISETVRRHFEDIGQDENTHDVTYENAQARIRTLVLMDLANMHGGLVVGTGDLSELALGWATYNGDHMSMYAVNASVPKTLMRSIIAYCAETAPALRDVLLDILDTPVSPELLPAENEDIAQRTEDLVGPYEIHDFILYHMLQFGFTPKKIYRMACYAFSGQYSSQTILSWLKVFYRRFFSQQFKRSCLPDGPKTGAVGLSPRGDLRMPSDACAALWLRELDEI